jgi:hypothetical protein
MKSSDLMTIKLVYILFNKVFFINSGFSIAKP